jgi:large subunit ribosomal protein L44e
MKIEKEMNVYCPYCNKHTLHAVKMPKKNTQRGFSIGTRRHMRAIKGYVGSVEVKLRNKKIGKKQKVMLECKICKKSVERVVSGKAKKKIEIKK